MYLKAFSLWRCQQLNIRLSTEFKHDHNVAYTFFYGYWCKNQSKFEKGHNSCYECNDYVVISIVVGHTCYL